MGGSEIVVRVMLHGFPSLAIVQLHPVIFSIFDFASVLEGLSKEVSKVVVVRSVLEAKVSYIAQVFVKFFYRRMLVNAKSLPSMQRLPGKPSQRSLIAVVCFFSPIFSYFCLLVAALSPCHGNPPRRKYMKT